MKNIILLAVQGAGKGTVSESLEEKYNYVHISTGDLLRERRKKDDEIGRIIAETQDKGSLTPQKIVFKVLEERLSEKDVENGYILDGFPRTLDQALEYDKLLNKIGKEAGIVINLTVPDDILIDRITSRRTCNKCGKIYNVNFASMKPKIEGKCDDCDGELFIRSDDANEDAIRTRINIYHENVGGLISFYKDKGILFDIDSTETKKAIVEVEKLIED